MQLVTNSGDLSMSTIKLSKQVATIVISHCEQLFDIHLDTSSLISTGIRHKKATHDRLGLLELRIIVLVNHVPCRTITQYVNHCVCLSQTV